MDYNGLLKKLSELDPKRKDKSDELYTKAENRDELLRAGPWRNDPDYFKHVQISSLALVRMAMHARSGGVNEVMGMLIGKIIDRTFVVLDVYPLPVEASETRVNAMGEAYEYMVQYLDSLHSVGRKDSILGWYHSHPSYGCWLSRIDVETQRQNQTFQDPFLAIVVDPNRTVANSEVEIGAFRTYPEGHNNTQSAVAAPVTAKEVDSEFGLYSKEYYPLEVSYFRTSLDEPLFDLAWSRYWPSQLAENRLLVERELSLAKIKETVAKIALMQPQKRRYSKVSLNDLIEDLHSRVEGDVGSLVALKVRNSIFRG